MEPHPYQITKALDGMDGRGVHFAFASQAHSFLYDTSRAAGVPTNRSLDAISIPELSTTVRRDVRTWSGTEAPPIHLVKSLNLDRFGNANETIDYGRQGIDAPIRSTTHWELPTGDTTGWMWRPMMSQLFAAPALLGVPTDHFRRTRFTYDTVGNLKSVTSALQGTEALERHHAGGGHTATPPSTASADGPVDVLQKD
jgi:YD repeat-containing protein